MEEVIKQLGEKIDNYQAKTATTEQLEALKQEVQELANKGAKQEDIEAFKTSINTIEESVNVLKDSLKSENINAEKTIFEAVKEQKEEIVKLVKGTPDKEVVIKANTLRASITNSASQNMLTGIGQLGVKLRALYDIFRKVQLSNNTDDAGKVVYHDWDEATTVRAAAMVAEGAQFPESTAKFAKYSIDLKKIGDTLPVSEEFGEDEASAAAELEMFLDTNVNSVIDNQIAVGAGTGQNLTGLTTSAPVYTAVASGIADANIKDLARKMRTTITKNRGSKYKPNFVAANSDVIDQYILKKDANNNYMFDSETGMIAGLMVVEDNNLPDNTLVVGDSRFGTIYEKGGLTLSKVYVNAQAMQVS